MTRGVTAPGSPDIALGIDVGGTKVALAIVDAAGRITGRTRIPVTDAGTLLAETAVAAAELAERAGRRLAGVGVGVPELVSPSGEIRSSSVIAWRREAVEAALSPLGEVVIEADVRAAALAEASLGAGRSLAAFAYLTLGTGISSALVLDGEPFAGAHGCAELLGSAPLSVCQPGNHGLRRVVLEEVASGRALVARFSRAVGRRVTGVEDILAAASDGDAAAGCLLREAATVLGSYVALLINVLDPQAVVVGGGLGAARTFLWDHLVAAARDHTWAPDALDTPIVQAALGADSGVIGAALAAQRKTSQGKGPGSTGAGQPAHG